MHKQKPSPTHYHEWILPSNYESLPYHDYEDQTIFNEIDKTCTKTKKLFHKQIRLHPQSLKEALEQKIKNKFPHIVYNWQEKNSDLNLQGIITKCPEWIVVTITTIKKINGTEFAKYK